MKIIIFNGYASLNNDVFIFDKYLNYPGKETNFKEKITTEKDIKIYLARDDNNNHPTYTYNKIYNSSDGFTLGKICTLIFETYYKALDEIYKGDKDNFSDLVLEGIEYDEVSNSIYPILGN